MVVLFLVATLFATTTIASALLLATSRQAVRQKRNERRN